jgi:DNA-nicking Smr family endonuclease
VRSLSPEESALWARVASTIRPLSRDRNDQEAIEATSKVPATAKSTSRPTQRPTLPNVQQGFGTTLDGTWDRKLRGGTLQPDRTIDLHGMTLDGAWRTIDRALEQAVSHGDRVILLITGHQRSGAPPIKRGVIRAAVHDWLHASRHAGQIAAVRPAHRRHGGGGSLYIILRQTKARTVY